MDNAMIPGLCNEDLVRAATTCHVDVLLIYKIKEEAILLLVVAHASDVDHVQVDFGKCLVPSRRKVTVDWLPQMYMRTSSSLLTDYWTRCVEKVLVCILQKKQLR